MTLLYKSTTRIPSSVENERFYEKLFEAAKKGDLNTLTELAEEMATRVLSFISFYPGKNLFPFMLCCVYDEHNKMPWDYIVANKHQFIFDICYEKSFLPTNYGHSYRVANFLWAFVCNQIEAATEFLTEFPDFCHGSINSVAPVPEGPLLIVATRNNCLPLVQFLIQKGVKDSKNSSDNPITALSEACRLGHTEIASFLKRHNHVLQDEFVIDAILREDIKFIQTMLSTKSYQNQEILDYYFSCCIDNMRFDSNISPVRAEKLLAIALAILEEKQDLHLSFLYASWIGDLDLMKRMLQKGNLNIDFYTDTPPIYFAHFHRKTALFLAAQRGHVEIVEYLLAMGAKVDMLEGRNTLKEIKSYQQVPNKETIIQLLETHVNDRSIFQIFGSTFFNNQRKSRPSEAGFATYQSPRPGGSNQN